MACRCLLLFSCVHFRPVALQPRLSSQYNNQLTSLPSGVFANLTTLQTISLVRPRARGAAAADLFFTVSPVGRYASTCVVALSAAQHSPAGLPYLPFRGRVPQYTAIITHWQRVYDTRLFCASVSSDCQWCAPHESALRRGTTRTAPAGRAHSVAYESFTAMWAPLPIA